MNDIALDDLFTDLRNAARLKNNEIDIRFGDPATDEELGRCEASLGLRLPKYLRALLADYNGIHFEIYTLDRVGGTMISSAEYDVPSADWIVEQTTAYRSFLADVDLRLSSVIAEISRPYLQVEVLDADTNVLLFVDEAHPDQDYEVFALDQSSLVMKRIASSYRDHVRLSLARMITSGTDFAYWKV